MYVIEAGGIQKQLAFIRLTIEQRQQLKKVCSLFRTVPKLHYLVSCRYESVMF